MNDYEFNEDRIKDLTKATEPTSAIATIVYEIENAKYNELDNRRIVAKIEVLQKIGKFPPNLKLIDIEYDPDTSFCAVAFQDTDTGLVTVGTAGTNLNNGFEDSIKDVSQWGEIAFNGESASAAYFETGNAFIQNLEKEGYIVDGLAGHSLASRNNVILGMANNIPNIISYNGAPLANYAAQGMANVWDLARSDIIQGSRKIYSRMANNVEMVDLIKNYDGRIVNFVSENDPLNDIAGSFGSLYSGEIFVVQNGKGHEMMGFLDDETQAFIQRKLVLVDENGEVISASDMAKEILNTRINELNNLRKKFLASSGGGLSSNQAVFLDTLEAKAITEGMVLTTEDKIAEIKNLLERSMEEANELWKNTLSDADTIGTHLSYSQQVEALASGNATKSNILTQSIQEYEDSLSKLFAFEEKYKTLLDEIESAIEKLVSADQELIRYFE